MKYENNAVEIGAGYIESILNEGLRVLVFMDSVGPGEGEAFTLIEMNGDTPTGRKFFARVMHAPDPQAVQFNLMSYMEDVNPDTGVPERIPLAGEFANERAKVPEDTSDWDLSVQGEKPLWVYRGVKWVGEYSVAGYKFDDAGMSNMANGKPGVPLELKLKVQGQGGENFYTYRLQ